MSSLIQSMCEVLKASVKKPCGENTPLKIKLAVTPSVCPDKIATTGKMFDYFNYRSVSVTKDPIYYCTKTLTWFKVVGPRHQDCKLSF